MVIFETMRPLAMALPEVTETAARSPGAWFGMPGFKVRGKSFAWLRPEWDVLVVRVTLGRQEVLIEAQPHIYFITPHYAGSPYVLVRLAEVEEEEDLDGLLADAWRLSAPRRLVAGFEATRSVT